MKIVIFAAIVGATFAGTTVPPTPAPVQCMSDDDCTPMECCYKKHEFLVVSKRGQTFEGYPVNPQDLSHTPGVCQSYHEEGDSCTVYDKQNGYCSCNEKAGMGCMLKDPSATGLHAMYGQHTCQYAPMPSK